MRIFLLLSSVLIPFTLFAQIGSQTRLLSAGIFEKWESVEIGIQIPEQERNFRMFLEDHSRGKNPYTADFIWMQFSCNGKKYLRPAFYMEDAKPDIVKNIFIAEQSEWPWRVRFSPPEAGDYECVLLVGEDPKTATPQSTGVRFHVNESSRHGILNIEPGESRMSFSDGTPFFVLGQNIAWCDAILKGGPAPNLHPVYQSGYYDWFHYMHNLADNGGNYVRIVVSPWGFGIGFNDVYTYEQDKAIAMDSVIKIAEERGLYIHFCVELTNGFFANIPKDQWHPIRRAYQKEGMLAADLLKDSAALVAFDNYLRYVHARWAYSANVAVIEVIPEHYNFEGFKEREQNFYDYYTHVNRFMKNKMLDSMHLIGTSVDRDEVLMCKHPELPFIDIHHYDSKFWSSRRRYFVVEKFTKRFNKAFLFGEMGIVAGPVNACDPDDWEYCSDITMHNALWATAFSGGMGTGLYWWQWNNDAFREANYKPLRWFVDSVAYGMKDYTDANQWDGNGLEVYYCKGNSKRSAAGWVHNTSYWWANTIDTSACHDRSGKTMLHPKDDDKSHSPVDRSEQSFVIKGMKPRIWYHVQFYDTRNPGVEIGHKTVKSSISGRIRIKFSGSSDCAFKISLATRVTF